VSNCILLVGHCLSKAQMTRHARNVGGMASWPRQCRSNDPLISWTFTTCRWFSHA